MLLDEHYNHYTIESIGLECGFTSKSNFYTSFKKISGQTPNQYKKLKKEVLDLQLSTDTELKFHD